MDMSRERMCRRIYGTHMAVLLLFCALLLRIFWIGQGEKYTSVAETQSRYTLAAGEVRGMIYDCRMKPLVNRTQQTLLAIDPQPQTIALLREELPQERFSALLPQLESGCPVLVKNDFAIEGEGIIPLQVAQRYEADQLAPHIIGYVNGDGAGVCGIEIGYNDSLARWGGSVRVRYTVNARGMALGSSAELLDDRSSLTAGVVLTLDRELQAIVEEAAKSLQKGAVVLMEADTGKIRALASVPDFDVNDVAASLSDADSPLLNRATAAWNVGSIFKVCVTAAALESGTELPQDFYCPGYYQLGDRKFYCHDRDGHGSVTLLSAFQQSCNPYFVALGQRVGARQLLRTAQAMGFGSAISLAQGITSAAGSLPEYEKTTAGELANLSFGQGRLTASPVQIARMFSIVANGGYDVSPTLLEGLTADGAVLDAAAGESAPLRVISAETAAALQNMLVMTVEGGTGARAQNAYCGAGGKTSSAQTGTYVEGEEIVHAWFGGFFPADDPKYVLVVFQEGGQSGGQVPAAVFRSISEAVYLHEHPSLERTLW